MLRIISGTAKGLRLHTPSQKKIRPTMNKVKESLFNILQFRIEGCVFLDLFSGTGQIGIEAASRGAKMVYLVEKYRDIINKNINRYKTASKGTCNIKLLNFDAIKFFDMFEKKVDIAFVDAPFNFRISQIFLNKLSKIINKNGLVVFETQYKDVAINKFDDFNLIKRYRYGRISLDFYSSLRAVYQTT
ncbi:MAG: 16S rRNA (guanine(966)-N(2))-methyltransferase RsmD [Firmicutes bacterium]|nr:16S rRNA (guanine(966)-N(2))-methyltransferase RsmD [Bacillota bacterium]